MIGQVMGDSDGSDDNSRQLAEGVTKPFAEVPAGTLRTSSPTAPSHSPKDILTAPSLAARTPREP